MRRLLFAVCALAAAAAHAHDEARPASSQRPDTGSFPTDIGGPFKLIDQHGDARTEVDPDGRPQLVFFGYATCTGICSAALPTLAHLTDLLAEAGKTVTPILVTVDPAVDTVAALRAAAPEIHPSLIALSGDAYALAATREAFQVEAELLFVDPDGRPVYAHGSYIYLLDAEGAFLTLLPPILSPARMTEIVLSYL